MGVKIDIYHHFPTNEGQALSLLLAQLEKIMSTLSDKIAEVTTAIDGIETRVAAAQAEIASLKDQIAALEATVASGGATPDDLAALNAAVSRLTAILPAIPLPPPTP